MGADFKLIPRILDSADHSPWLIDADHPVSKEDGLPIRSSGPWIETKHRLLTHYAKMFSSGMKGKWDDRVYLELFSGPGRCLIRDNNEEDLGSPLKVIGCEFTKFIFIEKSVPVAGALAQRLSKYPQKARVDLWCGDCAEAVRKIEIPRGALTFAFIDPTGIAHAPFSLIKALQRNTKADLLINIQHGMGIKMNMHQYTPDADERSALTQFLGDDAWKSISRNNPKDFFLGVLDLYKERLSELGYIAGGREVLISTQRNRPLYLLLFASKHERGTDFWNKSMKGVLEPDFGF